MSRLVGPRPQHLPRLCCAGPFDRLDGPHPAQAIASQWPVLDRVRDAALTFSSRRRALADGVPASARRSVGRWPPGGKNNLAGQGTGEFSLVREVEGLPVRSDESPVRTRQVPEDRIAELAPGIRNPGLVFSPAFRNSRTVLPDNLVNEWRPLSEEGARGSLIALWQ